MKTRVGCVLAVAAQFAIAAPALAVTTWTVQITNAQENPPTNPTLSTGGARPASFGTGVFVLDDAQTAFTFEVDVFNIDFTGTQTADVNDNLTNAHFHAGAGVTPTTNGGVVFGFIGSPFNDNNPNDTVVTPFAAGVGGHVSGKWDTAEGNNTTLTAQIGNLLAGRAYINFHTVQFGGGEIRGNLTPVVPEPASWAMMIGGFGLIGGAMRSTRRKHEIDLSVG